MVLQHQRKNSLCHSAVIYWPPSLKGKSENVSTLIYLSNCFFLFLFLKVTILRGKEIQSAIGKVTESLEEEEIISSSTSWKS